MPTDYDENDAAKDTETSTGKTAEAWHTARDDSGVREGKDTEELKSAPEWAPETTPGGQQLFPEGKGPNDGKDEEAGAEED